MVSEMNSYTIELGCDRAIIESNGRTLASRAVSMVCDVLFGVV